MANSKKRPKGMSKREYAAKLYGGSPSDYNSDGSKKDNTGVGNTSLEKMKGFDPSYFGTAFQEGYSKLSNQEKAVFNVIAPVLIQKAQQNEQVPVTLTDKEIKQLWKDAENDETIKTYYAEDLRVGTEALKQNLDTLSSDFQTLTKEQQQQYLDAKKKLSETQAAAGTAYSGFREQAKGKLESQQADVVQSSRSQLQNQLKNLQMTYEQKYGSKALSDLGLSGVSGYSGKLVGVDYTGAGYGTVSYSPLGGLSGTQATAKLQDVAAKEQELARQKLQQLQKK